MKKIFYILLLVFLHSDLLYGSNSKVKFKIKSTVECNLADSPDLVNGSNFVEINKNGVPFYLTSANASSCEAVGEADSKYFKSGLNQIYFTVCVVNNQVSNTLRSFELFIEKIDRATGRKEFSKITTLEIERGVNNRNKQIQIQIDLEELDQKIKDEVKFRENAEKARKKTKEIEERESRKREQDSKVCEETNRNLFGNCFTGDTLVRTDSKYCQIEKIAVGDRIQSCKISNSEIDPKVCKVTDKHERYVDKLLGLKIGEVTIWSTEEHPFLVDREGELIWLKAVDIDVDTDFLIQLFSLHSSKNNKKNIRKIKISSIEENFLDEEIKVFDLTIEPFHYYFVSENNILVHNCNDPISTPDYFNKNFNNNFDKMMISGEFTAVAACGVTSAACGLGLVTPGGQVVGGLACGAAPAICEMAGGLVAGHVIVKSGSLASSAVMMNKKDEDSNSGTRNPAQDKMLSKPEAKKVDAHKIKRDVLGKKAPIANYDLYKDKAGNIYVKPKGGKGPGEPTGVNIND